MCFALSAITPLKTSAATNQDKKIDALNLQLDATTNPKEKAKLYCYRARNYEKSGNTEEAKKDYFRALNTSYDGWILNELGYFMYKHGEYEKAYNISLKVIDDFPHLKKEAEPLKIKAKKMWDDVYSKENPPTIIMDSEPDSHRVTRHDLIRQSEQNYRTAVPAGSTQTAKPNRSTGTSSGGSHISGFGANSAFRKNYIESRKKKGQ